MKSSLLLPSLLLAHLISAGNTLAGSFTQTTFSGDLDSGISGMLNYTAKADFNGSGTRVVNGVTLNETATAGNNYALTGTSSTFTGFANNLTGSVQGATSDFFYGGADGNATLTLTNLVVGQRYATSWQNAAFGGAGSRVVSITPSDTGLAYSFDENFSGASNGNLLRYVFTASATSLSYAFNAAVDGDSFHHYSFTNSVVTSVGPVITTAAGAGPNFSPFAVSNSDLLQTSILGTPTTGGNLSADATSGGAAALTNGSFAINGGNPADNSPLAAAANNSFVAYTLNTTINKAGYNISSINLYGGWNDAGRDHQLVNISYSVIGRDEWIPFDTLDVEPPTGTIPSAVSAIFAASLTGVDGVRFDFPNGQENGYVGYGEFDVIGTPSVPEPTTTGLLSGLAALGFFRRRRA